MKEFICSNHKGKEMIDVEVLTHSDGIPYFKYNFGTRVPTNDNPQKIGEMLVLLETKKYEIIQLFENEGDWRCDLTDDIRIENIHDIFAMNVKQVSIE